MPGVSQDASTGSDVPGPEALQLLTRREELAIQARRARQAGRAGREHARSARLGSLEARSDTARLRRALAGPIFAMDGPSPEQREPSQYFERSVPLLPGAPSEDGSSIIIELDDRGYVTGCPVGEPREVVGYAARDLVGLHASVLYDTEASANGQAQSDLTAAPAGGGFGPGAPPGLPRERRTNRRTPSPCLSARARPLQSRSVLESATVRVR